MDKNTSLIITSILILITWATLVTMFSAMQSTMHQIIATHVNIVETIKAVHPHHKKVRMHMITK